MRDEHIIQAAKKEQQDNNSCETCGLVIPKGHTLCKNCYRTFQSENLI